MARDANLNRIQAYYPILFLTLTLPANLRIVMTSQEFLTVASRGVSAVPCVLRCPSGVVALRSLRNTASTPGRPPPLLWLLGAPRLGETRVIPRVLTGSQNWTTLGGASLEELIGQEYEPLKSSGGPEVFSAAK